MDKNKNDSFEGLLDAAIKANQYLAYLASEGKLNDSNEVNNWTEVQNCLFTAIKEAKAFKDKNKESNNIKFLFNNPKYNWNSWLVTKCKRCGSYKGLWRELANGDIIHKCQQCEKTWTDTNYTIY